MDWLNTFFTQISANFTPEFLADMSGRMFRVVIILVGAAILRKVLGKTIPRLNDLAVSSMRDPHHSAAVIDLERRAATLSGILTRTITLVIWGLAIAMALREIGFDITPIIAGAGVAGLAVGFGAQSLVKDVMTGLVMLVENNIRVGDVASIGGVTGAVESINLRTTHLRDLTGTVHVVPNGDITIVSNLTRDYSCYVINMGISYESDFEKAIRLMNEALQEMQGEEEFGSVILNELEMFGVDSFADSSVVIKCRIRTLPSEQWRIGREFNRRVKIRFDKEGIVFPYPQRTISWLGPQLPVQVQPASREQADANTGAVEAPANADGPSKSD